MTDTQSGAGDAPKSPEEIRQEIDQTRDELGDTVEALAAKTDVKAQVSDRVETIKQDAATRVDSLKQDAAERIDKAKEAVPDSAGEGAQQVADTVKAKPVPYTAGGAFLAGFLLGWLFGRR